MARPLLSVIIPAYNEFKRLPLTLIDVDRHLSAQDFSYEIITVVSQGTDPTLEIAKRFELFIKNLKVTTLPGNWGKGGAIRAGMRAAKGTYKLYMDADNSTAVVEFVKMLPYFLTEQGKADVVIGSRFLPGSHRDPELPIIRRIISWKGRLFSRWLIVPGIQDPFCGFKCFTSEAAEKIFGQVSQTGFGVDLEVLVLAQKANLKIVEVPIFWTPNLGPHRDSASYWAQFLDAVRLMWTVRLRR